MRPGGSHESIFDDSITVMDNGSGFPVDENEEREKSAAEVVMNKAPRRREVLTPTLLHKFRRAARRRSFRRNFLSETLHLEIWRDFKDLRTRLFARDCRCPLEQLADQERAPEINLLSRTRKILIT